MPRSLQPNTNVTAAERADLESVAVALGLAAGAVEASLDPAAQPATDVCEVGGFALKPGDAVVFTGDAPGVDRTDLEYQARALGLRVTELSPVMWCRSPRDPVSYT